MYNHTFASKDEKFGHLGVHFAGFEKLLNAFDEIRNLIGNNDEDIKIPKVVVIGDQSHGKSSLMELISGIDLPRNDGICTRVPCELRLRKCTQQRPTPCIIISAQHDRLKQEVEIQRNEINTKIQEYTKQLIPTSSEDDGSVADKPITLTIYGKDLPNLTMVDLPGLIHHDSNRSKIKEIKEMVKKYIKSEQSIIVNVLNSTCDAATAESLSLSKDVDPERKRTLLVLTKIDINDQDLHKKYRVFVTKERFPPNKVFLVRSRTNKENEANVSLAEVQQNEAKYLAQRADLKEIPKSSKGSKELAKRLVQIQKKKMFDVLPSLKRDIQQKYEQLLAEKAKFVDQPLTKKDCKNALRSVLRALFKQLNILVKAKGDLDNSYEAQYICSKTLEMFSAYAAKIRMIRTPAEFMSEAFRNQIRTKSRKINGFEGFPNEVHASIAVEMLRDLVKETKKPTMCLIDDVHGYLVKVVEQEIGKLTEQYPRLQQVLNEVFGKMMKVNYQRAQDAVLDILEIEARSRPFTNDDHYMQTVMKMEEMLTKKENGDESSGAVMRDPMFVHVSGNTDFNGEYQLQANKCEGRVWYKGWKADIDDEKSGEFAESKHDAYDDEKEVVLMRADTSGRAIKFDGKQWCLVQDKQVYYVCSEFSEATSPIFCEQWEVKDGFKKTVKVQIRGSEQMYMETLLAMSNVEQLLVKQAIKIAAFWSVVTRRICDSIPMQIFYKMAEKLIAAQCEDEVFDELDEYEDDQWRELMSVDEEMQHKMVQNKIEVDNMEKANAILSQIKVL